MNASSRRAVCQSVGTLYFFIIIILSAERLSPLGTATATGLLYKPQMIDDGDCEAIGGMNIGRGNRSTRRKPAPAPLCPLQIPYEQTCARNPGRRGGKPALAAWAMAQPRHIVNQIFRYETVQSDTTVTTLRRIQFLLKSFGIFNSIEIASENYTVLKTSL
jgi:hypothetical protein